MQGRDDIARPEHWHTELSSYPVTIDIGTRFADLDPLGHVNNVAMAAIFETARIRFHQHIGRHPRDQGVRWLVAAVSLNYLAETHFPAPVLVGTGYTRIGDTSWSLLSGAFQEGVCVATCETVIVAQGAAARRFVDEITRAESEPYFVQKP